MSRPNYMDYIKDGKSFIIQASAGTGKTYSIMQMVKALLAGERGEDEPGDFLTLDKILIVTYTEKAVGELKNRIREELKEAIENKQGKKDDPIYSDAQVELFKDALKISSNAPIFTIHSFCQSTLKEAAFLAKVPVALEMTDDGDIEDMLEERLRDEFAAEFINFKTSPENERNSLESILKEKKGLTDILKNVSDKYYLSREANEKGEYVSGIVELAKERYDFDGLPKEKEFIGSKIKDVCKRWLFEKQNRRLQSFNDMIRNLREAICSGSKDKDNPLVKYLRSKYRVAIIDEFQDTNQRQWDIFKNVFFDKENGLKSFGKHSLIAVGDPKQSIYSFQGADVQVYSEAYKRFEYHDSLKQNYRSTQAVVKACNSLFGKVPNNEESKDFFAAKVGKSDIIFERSDYPERKNDGEEISIEAKWSGTEEEIKPIWLARRKRDGETDEYDFARFAACKIEECCKGNAEHGPLQIYDKRLKSHRPIEYSDFAVLCRTRTELPPIISQLDMAGIPYVKYKDDKLFEGKECADWIAILEAIDADDFAGSGRKILQKALFSKFFEVSLGKLGDQEYDYPECKERVSIQIWKKLAEERKWFELIDSIFSRTGIEYRKLDSKYQNMVFRIRQIGDYIQSYLVSNRCGLKNCIEHLKGLNDRKCDEDAEDDGNIVDIGTDDKCVRIMTIHASKGLEFPVVISVAGFKGRNNQVPHCWQGHIKGQSDCHLPTGKFIDIANDKEFARTNAYKKRKDNGFKGDVELFKKTYCVKIISDNEQKEEYKRLFYVDYTRAGSLLILPYYSNFKDDEKEFRFVGKAIDRAVGSGYVQEFDPSGCKISYKKPGGSNNMLIEPSSDDRKRFSEVQERADSALSHKHSYSSLKDMFGNCLPDRNAVQVAIEELYDRRENDIDAMSIGGGTLFGTALHEAFEKCDFSRFRIANGGNDPSDEIREDENREYVRRIMSRHGFFCSGSRGDKDKIGFVANMIRSSLNASLPRIRGSNGPSNANDTFKLCDIDGDGRIAEAEFLFNAGEDGAWIRQYCDGFIDLLFTLKDNDGNNRYCILDWKSDKLEQGKLYSVSEHLKERVDADYSVQRVLYSYCLARWLSSMYSISMEEAFDRHFGGIYYVFARGAVENKSNGIYAQTWNGFDELKRAYDAIRWRIAPDFRTGEKK